MIDEVVREESSAYLEAPSQAFPSTSLSEVLTPESLIISLYGSAESATSLIT